MSASSHGDHRNRGFICRNKVRRSHQHYNPWHNFVSKIIFLMFLLDMPSFIEHVLPIKKSETGRTKKIFL